MCNESGYTKKDVDLKHKMFNSVQGLSCLTLCDPMDCKIIRENLLKMQSPVLLFASCISISEGGTWEIYVLKDFPGSFSKDH